MRDKDRRLWRKNRMITAVILVLIGSMVAVGVLLMPLRERLTSQFSAEVPYFDISSFLNARRITDYEQPDSELAQAISAVYDASAKGESQIPEGCGELDIVMVDKVPFSPYWQGEVGKYAFHPMRLGGFLAQLSCDEHVKEYVDAATKMAHPLQNGGLLWYYPDNYSLNRFLGPDLSPSAIGQAEILGAITGLDRRCGLDLSEVARKAFLGLRFDYYHGGVNLHDKVLLELPLFRSAPEIILNGWQHALLNLKKYADFYGDPEAKELFRSNLRFLAESLENFHDEKSGLSLYSDLCPYRVRVSHQEENPPLLTVFYKARNGKFDDLAFELKVIEHSTRSPYDNQIIRQTRTFTDVWISCSRNYETYLVSDRPITASFYTGEYSPYRSTPGTGGEKIELESKEMDNYHVVHVTSVRDKLFCGYPTNFSKMGENFYHTYHVVALACLLAYPDLPDNVRAKLRTIMDQWINSIETFESSEGIVFSSYDSVLSYLVKHEIFTLTDKWDVLLEMARKRW